VRLEGGEGWRTRGEDVQETSNHQGSVAAPCIDLAISVKRERVISRGEGKGSDLCIEKPPPGALICSRKLYIAGRSIRLKLSGVPISQRVSTEAKVGALREEVRIR
jgi:hypothetical protein